MRDFDFGPLLLLEMEPLADPGPFLCPSSMVSSSLALLIEFAAAVPFVLPDDDERSVGLCCPCSSAILKSATTAEDRCDLRVDLRTIDDKLKSSGSFPGSSSANMAVLALIFGTFNVVPK